MACGVKIIGARRVGVFGPWVEMGLLAVILVAMWSLEDFMSRTWLLSVLF
jgi:hypothetical protein